jgi:hypothetical protein
VLTERGATFQVTADRKVVIVVHPDEGPALRTTVPAGTTEVRL